MFNNVQIFKRHGDIGMAYAIAYYSKIGYIINIPLTDSQDYDLIVDNGISLLKVQVKTTDCKSKYGIYVVRLKTCGGNKSGQKIKSFKNNSSDLLFILTSCGTCYSIPSNKIKDKNSLNLGNNYEQYKVSLSMV